jgi:hypothetical protein
VPEDIRRQAEAFAKSLHGSNGRGADPAMVHAIISQWMRTVVHRALLAPNRA